MIASRSLAYAALAAVAAWPFTAGAAELPQRKAGLWQLTMNAQGDRPATTMQQCTDAATDKLLTTAASPVPSDNCSRNEVSQTSSGYTTESVCTFSGQTTTTQSEITGDFNSAYTATVSSRGSGNASATTMTIESKWVGACASDQKPGDVVMPNGTTFNVVDLAAARKVAR